MRRLVGGLVDGRGLERIGVPALPLDRGVHDIATRGGEARLDRGVIGMVVRVRADDLHPRHMLGAGHGVTAGRAFGAFVAAPATVAAVARPALGGALLGLGLLGGGAVLLDQRAAVGRGDLVVIRVDLGEGQEAVTVPAVIHEGRLQRGLDPRDLGQVDVSGELPLVQCLEIKVFDLGSVRHDDPSFLGMRGVDQHFLCHESFFRAARAVRAKAGRTWGCGLMRTRGGRRTGLRGRRPHGPRGSCPAGSVRRHPSRDPSRLFFLCPRTASRGQGRRMFRRAARPQGRAGPPAFSHAAGRRKKPTEPPRCETGCRASAADEWPQPAHGSNIGGEAKE